MEKEIILKLKNWSYQIPDGIHKGETLWSGRYFCICGFVYALINHRWCILADKRGSGTPDCQEEWNCPCGFLEGYENGQEGALREIFEETTIKLNSPEKLHFAELNTEPIGTLKLLEPEHTEYDTHVTAKYYAILTKSDEKTILENALNNLGGEKNEVEEAKWISLKDIDNYAWAFGHDILIKRIWKKIPKRKKFITRIQDFF